MSRRGVPPVRPDGAYSSRGLVQRARSLFCTILAAVMFRFRGRRQAAIVHRVDHWDSARISRGSASAAGQPEPIAGDSRAAHHGVREEMRQAPADIGCGALAAIISGSRCSLRADEHWRCGRRL